MLFVLGMDRFCDDIINMIGFKPNVYWRFTWTFISPLFVMVGTVFVKYNWVLECIMSQYFFFIVGKGK